MGEVKRYDPHWVPILWDDETHTMGKHQMVVLATDYDALLADARRLRDVMMGERDFEDEVFREHENCQCKMCKVLRDTAYLEETP
jgi:hypothetical protein